MDMHNPSLPAPKTVLELHVRNHPGVMSHVCGLFARRAFNLDGILCMPQENEVQSRIWLLVRESDQLPQVMSQVSKLEDVLSVERHGADHRVFERLEAFFG